MVAKQLQRRPIVPRPRGSGAQPTMSVVEFIDVVSLRVLLCALHRANIYIYILDDELKVSLPAKT
jgi:hypothetical protein